MSESGELTKLIEIKKRKKIEEAVESNGRYNNMVKSLLDSGIKLDFDKFIEAYIESFGNVGDYNDIDMFINDNSINKFITITIDDINETRNGLVMNPDGTKNEILSTEQRLDMEFDNMPDYVRIENQGTLAEENLINDIFKREEHQEQVGFNLNLLSEETSGFYFDIANGRLTEEDSKKFLDNAIDNNKSEKSIDEKQENGFISTEEQLNLYINIFKLESAGPEERKIILEKIKKLPEIQKYKNPENGKIDIKSTFEAAKEWRQTYISQKREQLFVQYKNSRSEKGIKFADLSADDRRNILRAAVCTFEDKSASQEMKSMAISVLADMSSDLLISEKADDKFIFRINTDVLKAIYNGTRVGNNVTEVADIRKEFAREEFKMAMDKLEFLQKEVEQNGALKTREKWRQERLSKKEIDIGKEKKEFSEVLKKNEKSKIITFDSQERLGIRIDETLDSLRNPRTGKEMSATNKVNTVIGAYLLLKKSSMNPKLSDKERLTNEKAYKILEQHILEDPVDYGNYIDDDGKGNRKLKVQESETFLKSYTNKRGKFYKYSQAIAKETKKSAREELLKEGNLLGYVSKDGIEVLGTQVKDGIKNFIKRGLGYVLGETKSQKLINKISENKFYTATKRGLNKSFSGLYNFGKKTKSKFADTKRSKLALPSVTGNTKEKNVADSREEDVDLKTQNSPTTPVGFLGEEYVRRTNLVSEKFAKISTESANRATVEIENDSQNSQHDEK